MQSAVILRCWPIGQRVSSMNRVSKLAQALATATPRSSGRRDSTRFKAAGGTGGRTEFLEHVNDLAQRSREAGSVVHGTVGSGPGAIANGTIFREGSTYVVTDSGGVIRSFVPNAKPGVGIVAEFIRLGGAP
jgi:hypothetical protein